MIRAASLASRAARLPALARLPAATRPLCTGIDVDMCCRTYTMQVSDDPSAYEMDLVFEDFLDEAGQIEGVCGASRLVCKTFWDYKMILKFEDHDSIVNYMENHNDAINEAFLPRIQALAIGEVKQQNFVYDDIE